MYISEITKFFYVLVNVSPKWVFVLLLMRFDFDECCLLLWFVSLLLGWLVNHIVQLHNV